MAIFNVQRRSRSTSKPKHLRKQGLLPMALVERTHETMLIQAPVDALRNAMKHMDGLGRLDVQIDDEKRPRKAIVKNVEHDPLKHQLIHVTLQEVSEDDQVKIDVPVVAIGTPEAQETADALFMQHTDTVKVRGRMGDMPERIEVDVTGLGVGEHIEASALTLPEGVELISSPDATIFSLKLALLATEEPAETEGEEEAAEDSDAEPAETDHEGTE